MKLKVKRVSKTAVMPKYQSDGAAGIDLHLDLHDLGSQSNKYHRGEGDWFTLYSAWMKLPTGLAFEIPEGFEGQIRGRSSLAAKGWAFYVGTIDSDYRGPVYVLCKPPEGLTQVGFSERIAQIVIAPVARCEIVEVAELSETVRGEQGFGSTGAT